MCVCVRVCDNATEMFWNHFVSFRSEPEDKHEKMKSKMKRRKISKDEPDLQESALSKKLIAYQRKVLVRRTFLFFFFLSLSASLKSCIFCSSPQNYFARNFYNMRMLALLVAFAINFILLFYKVNVNVTHSNLKPVFLKKI